MKRLLALGFAVLLSAVMTAPAVAGPVAEVELVQRALADARAARPQGSGPLPMDRASVLFDRYVDLAAFESRVFVDVAPTLTPGQRQTLSEALRPLLVRRLALRLRDVPDAKPTIELPREENGEVHLRLVYKAEVAGDDIAVDLSFGNRLGATTPLRVVDATIGGVSLSKNLRASVNKKLRRDGFDALIARMKELRETSAPGLHKSSDITL